MKAINTAIAIAIALAGAGGAYYVMQHQPEPVADEHGHGGHDDHGHADHAEEDSHDHAGEEAHDHTDHDDADHAEHEHGESNEDGHDEHGSSVQIDDEAAIEGGIEVSVAGPGQLAGGVSLPGEIKLNENRIVHVVPRLPGVVREVRKNLGDPVVKGELLAVIDSRELADAKSGLLADAERRELARIRFEREKGLYEKKISSEEDYLSAKQAVAELDVSIRAAEQKLASLGLTPDQIRAVRSGQDATLTDYPIHAPIGGRVIEKHMSVGEAVADNADAFVIADLSTVWAEVVVYAADLKRIREGQPVTVRSADLDIQTDGVISYVGALVGEQTRTARAIVELPNPEGDWRPGLFINAVLADETRDVPVAVPADAIQTLRDEPVVFVAEGDTYEARVIQRGDSDGEMVEVLSGLAPGERYVSKNSYLIKADIEKAGAAHEH